MTTFCLQSSRKTEIESGNGDQFPVSTLVRISNNEKVHPQKLTTHRVRQVTNEFRHICANSCAVSCAASCVARGRGPRCRAVATERAESPASADSAVALTRSQSAPQVTNFFLHFHHQNPHLTFYFLHEQRDLVILRFMMVG